MNGAGNGQVEGTPRRSAIGFFFLLGLIAALVATSAAQSAPGSGDDFDFASEAAEAPGEWRLSWRTLPGRTYRLERSSDLERWDPVVVLVAEGETAVVVDSGMDGVPRTFWKVVLLDGSGEPLEVSEIIVSYQLSGAQSTALIEVVASGTETVEEVVFYDGEMVLGEAQRGIGDAWTFSVDWNREIPERRSLQAEVSTEEGTTERSGVRAFLLADPEKFLPLDPAGVVRPGQFVPIGADGRLGPFVFHPEGLGEDGRRTTGAHFEFPSGAELAGSGEAPAIRFSRGRFFRGHGDEFPVEVDGTPRDLPIADVDPAAVALAFGMVPGDPIPLRWGDAVVGWLGGSLSGAGWEALSVRPPIGDLVLPALGMPGRVVGDAGSGESALVVRFFGEWAPVPGSLEFRIPEADPLAIYVGRDGGVEAHGSAEAVFPSGARVKGGISWRNPNFEFRFEGRGITIPALGSLLSVLPEDPEDCLPVGDSEEELDTLAECLLGYRRTLRALSVGGLAETEAVDTLERAPGAIPHDPVGAALEGWAWRAATWAGDRAGQVLNDVQLREVADVVRQAGRTGEAARDLPTVLKLLRDCLVLGEGAADMVGAGPEADVLMETIASEQERLFTAAERVVADTPSFESGDALAAIARLVEEIGASLEGQGSAPAAAVAEDGVPARAEAATRFADFASRAALTIDPSIFSRRGIVTGDESGEDNVILASLLRPDLIAFLESDVVEAYRLLHRAGQAPTAGDAPPEYPVLEALRQTEFFLIPAHDMATDRAMASGSFPQFLESLAERLRILRIYEALGEFPLAGVDPFRVPTVEVMQAFQPVVDDWLGGIDPVRRLERYSEVASLLDSLSALIEDPALSAYLRRIWIDLSSFNERFIAERGPDDRCDELFEALVARGARVARSVPGHETAHEFTVTGRYESPRGEGTPYGTLQLNQGGSYVTGWWQVHSTRGRRMNRYLLRGLLAEEGDGQMLFSVLVIAEDDRILGAARLFAAEIGDAVQLTLSRTVGTRVDDHEFTQVSVMPTLPDQMIDLFTGREQEVLEAVQRSPFHTAELDLIEGLAGQLKALVREYHLVAGGPIEKLSIATSIEGWIRSTTAALSLEHVPLLEARLRQELSGDEFTKGDDTRTTQDWLEVLFIDHAAAMTSTAAMFGFDPSATEFLPRYAYRIEVNQGGAGGISGIGLGGGGYWFLMEITKTSPTGQVFPKLHYAGGFGQLSAGVPGWGAGLSNSVWNFTSPFNYGQEDFAGKILLMGAGASFITDTFKFSDSSVTFYGRGSLPPAIVDTSGLDIAVGYSGIPEINWKSPLKNLSVSIDVGFGYLWSLPGPWDPDDPVFQSLTERAAEYQTANQATFDANLLFEFDGSRVSACGWQYLRQFAADYAPLFKNRNSELVIAGFTDAVGGVEYNQGLSERRAASVETALRTILDSELRIPAERTRVVGLGEHDASAATGDGVPAPEWRKVVVVVNNLVELEGFSVEVDNKPEDSPGE